MSSTPAPRPRWKLVATSPGAADVVVGLPEGQFTVGRDPSCQLVLQGKQVSRRHATLRVGVEPFVVVEDLGSYNGTRVDGERIRTVQLRLGERVGVGEWTLLLGPAAGLAPGVTALVTAPVTAAAGQRTASMELPVPAAGPATVPATAPMSVPAAEKSGLRRSVAPAVTPAVRRVTGSQAAVTWQTAPGAQEEVRERAVGDSALLRRLTQQLTPLTAQDAGQQARELATLARQSDPQELALRLVYQVMAELRHARGEEDFLRAMADTLHQALRAQAVGILMVPEGMGAEAAPLEPRVVVGGPTDGSELRFSRSVVELALRKGVAVATEDARADERFARRDSVVDLDLKAALAVPMLRDDHAVGALYLTRRTPFSDAEEDLAAALGHLTALGIERVRLKEEKAEQEALQRTLERFHTPEVVEKLMQREAAGGGGGLFLEKLTATVLFCDLQGFTQYSDQRAPDEVAELLNRYLGEMTRVVYEHHGTVDKFIGDAVMAVFGAPFPAEDDAARAVRCALHMQRAFRELMETRAEDQRLALRIGINTGPVVAGTVGSPMRMEYTCLGDTVNVAQRLEGKAPAGGVLVGSATAAAVEPFVDLERLGDLQLKGKSGGVEAFLVRGLRTDATVSAAKG